jgi:hypothetical protein
MRGVPWQPNPAIKSFEIKAQVQFPKDNPAPAVRVGEREIIKRRFQIRKSDLDKHGRTVRCPGCDDSLRVLGKEENARNHTEPCRIRMAKALALSGDPRFVRAAEEAMAEYEAALPTPLDAGLPPPEPTPGIPEDVDPAPDDMSISPDNEERGNEDFHSEMFELTADPWKAQKLAKWEAQVTNQWKDKCWSDGVDTMITTLGDRDVRARM